MSKKPRRDKKTPPPQPMESEVTKTPEVVNPASAKIETRVSQYVQVRDRIREISDRHTQELAPLVETQNLLTAWLTEALSTAGAESIRTKGGTVYTTTRYSASLADPQSFMNYVIEHSAWDLLDKRANSTACRDFTEQKGSLPPGVNLNAIRTVGVRRASGS